MTTNLIESTSSAPTLREWAIAEWQRKVAEYEARERADRTADFKRKVDVLRMYLRDKIGLFDCESIQIATTKDVVSGFVATTVDGLRFTLKDLPHADSYRDRERLHVSVECSRGCGKDLWVNVESLEELGGALQPDATNTHAFGCLQQFDDDGEPITDRNGNPLPPKPDYEIVEPTPEQRARESIQGVDYAARQLAAAVERVTRLEDERAPLKAAAIKRLMATTNDLTGKPHSASSAEAVVELDNEYALYRALQRDAEIEQHRCLASYEAAKLTARLDVALATAVRVPAELGHV